MWDLARSACADVSGEEDMSKAVDIQPVEVIFGEIEFETAFEIPDSSFKLIPVEDRD